ncbi:FAD binding domain-containing protein [Rutstroemia sp. NJR-2017a BVV2]|nr:FAD binding domain-containing protein [Rutstroemia sp. NJR-2017a BVV2]
MPFFTMGSIPAQDRPLNVIVIGAGIGGLAAALALRREGHRVSVLEKSRFAAEIGAAVHIAPNCTRLLRRLGINPERYRANRLTGVGNRDTLNFLKIRALVTADTEKMNMFDSSGKAPPTNWDFDEKDWYLIHRAHLHGALKELALSSEGDGTPVKLSVSCNIVDMDPKEATVTLDSGETIKGDIVIGADGVKSWSRSYIAPDVEPYSSGKCCYRWLISFAEIEKYESLKKFSQWYGRMIEWDYNDRRIIIYPCVDNTMYNCGGFIPNHIASKEKLIQSYKGMGHEVEQLLALTPEDGLHIWELLDMDFLSTYTKDSLVLIGDAAHPFLPYMGQGAAMAIEDGVTLAALIPLGTSTDDISSRLQLYLKCRKERVERIQILTRENGKEANDPNAKRITRDEALAGIKYCQNYDAWESAKQMLVDSHS